MEVPSDWKTSGAPTGNIGHQEEGRTVAVHSLAVLPSLQTRGLGSTLLKAFVQRLGYVQAADRVVLLAHGDLVKFYEKLGFENKGPSKATFGGGNWVDMASLNNKASSSSNTNKVNRFWNSRTTILDHIHRIEDVRF